eukprot:EG_transcript_18578
MLVGELVRLGLCELRSMVLSERLRRAERESREQQFLFHDIQGEVSALRQAVATVPAQPQSLQQRWDERLAAVREELRLTKEEVEQLKQSTDSKMMEIERSCIQQGMEAERLRTESAVLREKKVASQAVVGDCYRRLGEQEQELHWLRGDFQALQDKHRRERREGIAKVERLSKELQRLGKGARGPS